VGSKTPPTTPCLAGPLKPTSDRETSLWRTGMHAERTSRVKVPVWPAWRITEIRCVTSTCPTLLSWQRRGMKRHNKKKRQRRATTNQDQRPDPGSVKPFVVGAPDSAKQFGRPRRGLQAAPLSRVRDGARRSRAEKTAVPGASADAATEAAARAKALITLRYTSRSGAPGADFAGGVTGRRTITLVTRDRPETMPTGRAARQPSAHPG